MDLVNVGSTAYLSVSFEDANGNPFVPTSVSYRLDDVATGTSIQGSTTAPAAATVDLTLTPANNAMVTPNSNTEVHQLTITATYGSGLQVVGKYDYEVVNLPYAG